MTTFRLALTLISISLVVGCAVEAEPAGDEEAADRVSAPTAAHEPDTADAEDAPLSDAMAATSFEDHHCVRRGPVLGDYVDICSRLYWNGDGSQIQGYGAMKTANAAVHLQLDGVDVISLVEGIPLGIQVGPLNGRSYIRLATPWLDNLGLAPSTCTNYSIRWRSGLLTRGQVCVEEL